MFFLPFSRNQKIDLSMISLLALRPQCLHAVYNHVGLISRLILWTILWPTVKSSATTQSISCYFTISQMCSCCLFRPAHSGVRSFHSFLHPQTSISKGVKLDVPLTFSNPNKKTNSNLQCWARSTRGQAQLTDIDLLGQAASTHFLSPPLFPLSLQSQGRHQPIDQPGAGNGLGQRG